MIDHTGLSETTGFLLEKRESVDVMKPDLLCLHLQEYLQMPEER